LADARRLINARRMAVTYDQGFAETQAEGLPLMEAVQKAGDAKDKEAFVLALRNYAAFMRKQAEPMLAYEGSGFVIGMMGGKKVAKKGRQFMAQADEMEALAGGISAGTTPAPWEA
jgi:hypothetical protein